MQEIPSWIIKVIEQEKIMCRNCNLRFKSDHLMSISIQEGSKPPHNDYLCIGLFCEKCKELMIFELKEMTLIDFAFEILDQETSNRIQKKTQNDDSSALNKFGDKEKRATKNNKIKSKITSKEIADVRKFLAPKDLTHEEFLIALGMLPSEIEKYNYKK